MVEKNHDYWRTYMKKILETERLYLRELDNDDIDNLKTILQDAETMYAYEHAFSDEETEQWLNNQLRRYSEYGMGLWAVIDKKSGEFVGQCGITLQDIGERERVYEIGYLLRRDKWGLGYASEAAAACKEYAFTHGIRKIYSIIRDNNLASMRVAIRNGMLPRKIIVKHYMGIDMPHICFMTENK